MAFGALSQGTIQRHFPGFIDEFTYWNVKLTGEEVTAISASASPDQLSFSSGLVSWWRFGEGDTYPTIADKVGSNDLTMSGMDAEDIIIL